MKDKEKYCPQCGEKAEEVKISSEEIREYQEKLTKSLIY